MCRRHCWEFNNNEILLIGGECHGWRKCKVCRLIQYYDEFMLLWYDLPDEGYSDSSVSWVTRFEYNQGFGFKQSKESLGKALLDCLRKAFPECRAIYGVRSIDDE